MSGPQFFETRMGRQFYQFTVPSIARSLEEISASLLILVAEKKSSEPVSKEIPQPDLNEGQVIPDISHINWTEENLIKFFKSIKPILIDFGIVPCPKNHAAVWNSHLKICPECGEDVTPEKED